MPVDETLTRVADDLAAGRTASARQRLRGLVAAFPARLDLRDRLAETYRTTGDPAQAGRWSYLGGSATAAETAAFEALHPHPDRRLAALCWPDGQVPGDPAGRRRLADLRAHSAALADGSAVWFGPHLRSRPAATPWRDRLGVAGCFLVVAALLALLVVGAGTVVRAVLG